MHAIPLFLNQPARWAFFERVEACLFAIIFVVCCFLGFMVIGLLLGVVAVRVKRKLQKSSLGDLTKIGMYWLLPHSMVKSFFNAVPPCYIREFLG